jgi:riboflavin synthase
MFTGIIAEVDRVRSIARKGLSTRLKITCEKVGRDLAIGDSVAINGVCLSIVDTAGGLSFDVVGNTLNMTGLKRLKAGDKVNLEGALRLGDALSGHMVSGHIDGERVVKNNKKTAAGWTLDIGISSGDKKYLVTKGAVAIDGVSLTVAEISYDSFRVFLIPHTLNNTILESKRPGDHVNVEFDVMSKYAEKVAGKGTITKDTLKAKGFIE